MPDGSKFVYENIQQNAEPTGDSMTAKKHRERLSISSAFGNSIPQTSEIVKGSDEKIMRLDRRKADKALDIYSEKEYNKYGWARVNGILSAKENADLRSKFAAVKSNQITQPKTKSGEHMIAIGDDVENKIVYMKGQIDDPVITRILVINETNETKLSELRRETYALEGRGIQPKVGKLFHIHTNTFSGRTGNQQGDGIQGIGYNNRLGADRGRGSAEAKRIVKFTVKEDGTAEAVYSDGSVEKDTFMYSDRRPSRERNGLRNLFFAFSEFFSHFSPTCIKTHNTLNIFYI